MKASVCVQNHVLESVLHCWLPPEFSAIAPRMVRVFRSVFMLPVSCFFLLLLLAWPGKF